MLSDDELREVLIDEARSMAEEAGENPDDMTVDEDSLATLMLAGRAVERAAYERAAQECDPHEDDDSIDRQIKRELAERILALGRQHD